MNHELIMLREVKRMRKLAKTLTEEARIKAIKSHATQYVKGGTIGQINEICQLIRLRDDCLLFCQAVSDALSAMDAGKRALLVQFYVKRAKAQKIADKYNVSATVIYRKLQGARLQFKERLLTFGYSLDVLLENVGLLAVSG